VAICKKNGQQLNRRHCPFRGGMNETYKRIDPVRVVMFNFVGLHLGNQLHKISSKKQVKVSAGMR
jgi:hypothetical protein